MTWIPRDLGGLIQLAQDMPHGQMDLSQSMLKHSETLRWPVGVTQSGYSMIKNMGLLILVDQAVEMAS